MELSQILRLIEVNIGKFEVDAIYIIDNNFKVLAYKGRIEGEIIGYYRRFPLASMNVGSIVYDKRSFLIKTTERTGVIVVMKEEHHAIIAAANLKGRINALSEMYNLDKVIEILEKEGSI